MIDEIRTFSAIVAGAVCVLSAFMAYRSATVRTSVEEANVKAAVGCYALLFTLAAACGGGWVAAVVLHAE